MASLATFLIAAAALGTIAAPAAAQYAQPYPQTYPQTYPQQGYGYPNQGYPNQGYPNQGYGNPNYASGSQAADLRFSCLRSLAIDRSVWSYGLPFYPVATLPWRSDEPEPLARVMIAQDTGSAIVGPARADLFFGGGDAVGALAGAIRHEAEMTVLWPRA